MRQDVSASRNGDQLRVGAGICLHDSEVLGMTVGVCLVGVRGVEELYLFPRRFSKNTTCDVHWDASPWVLGRWARNFHRSPLRNRRAMFHAESDDTVAISINSVATKQSVSYGFLLCHPATCTVFDPLRRELHAVSWESELFLHSSQESGGPSHTIYHVFARR